MHSHSLRMRFLVAITLAERIFNLAALSCKKTFLVLHHNGVEALPKVGSLFHLTQGIVLPSFCPKHPNEKGTTF